MTRPLEKLSYSVVRIIINTHNELTMFIYPQNQKTVFSLASQRSGCTRTGTNCKPNTNTDSTKEEEKEEHEDE